MELHAEEVEYEPAIILLVDDDRAVREVNAALIESLGYSVLQVSRGAKALEQMASDTDVVITDLAMPGMNGRELALALNMKSPDIPVIFFTSYADIEILRLEDRLALQKPFSEAEL